MKTLYTQQLENFVIYSPETLKSLQEYDNITFALFSLCQGAVSIIFRGKEDIGESYSQGLQPINSLRPLSLQY